MSLSKAEQNTKNELDMKSQHVSKEKIRLYLGYAPGKTTALNGFLIRALGADLKVKVILFSKCAENTSESKAYNILKNHYKDHFDYSFVGASRIRSDGSFRFFGDSDGWTNEDQKKLEQGIAEVSIDISSGIYDLLCLDEFTDLVYHKEQRISEELAKKLFAKIHDNTIVVITGHLCPEWLKELATTIIIGKMEKHYQGYTKGIEW